MNLLIYKKRDTKGAKYKLSQNLKDHLKRIICVEMSKKDNILVTGSEDETVKIWMLNTNMKYIQVQNLSRLNSPITSLEISEDSMTLLTGAQNSNLVIWTRNSEELRYSKSNILLGHKAPISWIVYIQTANTIMSGSEDNKLILWKCFQGKFYKFFQYS